jgi:hypothetical protein
MKLRRNQLCPIHRSLFCCGREYMQRQRTLHLAFVAWKTRIIREDTANCDLRRRCGSC